MSFHCHYVGHAELEKLVELLGGVGEVFANCVTESSAAVSGMENRCTLITVSIIVGEKVHYWRWQLASVLMISEAQPFDEEKFRRARHASNSAWTLVLGWLESKCGKVMQASVAMPGDLKYLMGNSPAFLEYTKQTAEYKLCEVVP